MTTGNTVTTSTALTVTWKAMASANGAPRIKVTSGTDAKEYSPEQAVADPIVEAIRREVNEHGVAGSMMTGTVTVTAASEREFTTDDDDWPGW